MDFFDNAVVKAKEAIDIACKKTNEVVNVGKQKFDIASIENKLCKDFEKLGRLYFEIIKDCDTENDDVNNLKAEITDRLDKIKELKEEINSVKSKRICPNCQADIDLDAVFCSKCGTKLVIDSEGE